MPTSRSRPETSSKSRTPSQGSRSSAIAIPPTSPLARESEAPTTLSKDAERNHEALLPNHESTLKITDPEFIELFDNWAFDDVLKGSPLDVRTRLMVQLAAIIACHAVTEYRIMLCGALNVGVTPVEAKEIVYQAVPYVGVAGVVDFLHATNEVLEERGIALPLEGQSTTTPETRFEKGLEAQKRIFGAQIDKMRAAAPTDQVHIQDFPAANCFGDYYTRNGLDLRLRELPTFAMLAAMGGCEPQLAGHVAGNIAMGNGREVLIGTVTQLLPYIGYPRTLNALRVIDQATQVKP